MTAANLPKPSIPYLRNSEWIYEHIDELTQRFPNQWIAVHNGAVIASGPDLSAVTRDAELVAPELEIACHFVNDGTLIY